jgi:hypothetical protein
MSGIFISYRREDSGAEAAQLAELLAKRFKILIDKQAIGAGENFPEVLAETVGFCDVLLAVIGPEWAGRMENEGRRRLEDPADWVRLEIATALSRRIKVIPILINGARMPGKHDLPESLALLAECQALEIRPQAFAQDAARLVKILESVIRQPAVAGMWFSVITRGEIALDPLDFQEQATLWRALRFLLYMVLAEAILHIPASPQEHLRYWDPRFWVSYIGATYISYLFAGVVLHYAMKAGGGKASLQKSIAGFGFVSAYIPLIVICQAPAWTTDRSFMEPFANLTRNPDGAIAVLREVVSKASAFGVLTIVMSFAAATAMWFLFARAVYRCFRTLHRMAESSARLCFAAGAGVVLAFLFLLFMPYMGNVYRDFALPAANTSAIWIGSQVSRVSAEDTAIPIQPGPQAAQ